MAARAAGVWVVEARGLAVLEEATAVEGVPVERQLGG